MPPILTKYPLTTMYVEVNDTNFLNTIHYSIQSPSPTPLIDIGIIFAANINYDVVNDRAVLHFNPNVTAVLEGHKTYIRLVQDRGIKVLLSILGNHQGVGICNFLDAFAARDFAHQLASTVTTYDLDGIDFDDEYADYAKDTENANETSESVDSCSRGPANAFSFLYLLRELRQLLPTKIISLYYYGPVMTRLRYEDLEAGSYLDYCWNGDYGKFVVPNVPGLDDSKLGPGAADILNTSPEMAAELAKKTVDESYGTYLLYRLPNSDVSAYLTKVSKILYGYETVVASECLQTWPAASPECDDSC